MPEAIEWHTPWKALMKKIGSHTSSRRIQRDLRKAQTLEEWCAKIERWHVRLRAERLEDTPFEMLFDLTE